jgi:SAM-dependent methyltransferase
MNQMSDPRILREKEFHDSAYESQVRSRLSVLYPDRVSIRRDYDQAIFEDCSGKKVLEYGCGLGSLAAGLASRGALVAAIDISQFAIDQARENAREKGLIINFQVMDAEHLLFEENSFDLVCGTSILHHLDLTQGMHEIRKVLKPGGRAVFIEPLGHNPIVNAFRALTPRLRSKDEHPLKNDDLKSLQQGFSRCANRYYYLLSFVLLPVSQLPVFRNIFAFVELVERVIFKRIPFVRKYGWQTLIILEK